MLKSLKFIIIFCSITGFQDQKKPDYNPMFFSMTNEVKDIAKDEPVFECVVRSLDTTNTTQTSLTVRLLSNSKGKPRLFFSEITTSVCANGVCKLAHIKVYWNLLGKYVGYGIYPKLPLTKFEHDLFEKKDYAKLHQLLLNENSIIKRRTISELLDEGSVISSDSYSKDLDAISGATKKEIEESVVKGGLFSCYTIWHIVHGEVKEKIRKYVESIKSDTLSLYFLYTPYNDYQGYALKELPKEDFKQHSDQITQIFKTTDGVSKVYILKKIPSDVLSEKNITAQFYNQFPLIDNYSKTLLINRLKSANPYATEILSNHLDIMTENQLKLYFKYLRNYPEFISKTCTLNLKKASKNKRIPYTYLIKEFLNTKR